MVEIIHENHLPLKEQTESVKSVSPYKHLEILRVFLMIQLVKNLPAIQETQVHSLGQNDPLEKEMEAHFSSLAWEIQLLI